MTRKKLYQTINLCIALVWLANGLFCKVLNMVPRHGQIVATILGEEYAHVFTILIGIAEIVMAIWVITGYLPTLNAITQITVIGIMNSLEFLLVPHLLLWGRFNALFAFLFMGIIFFNHFFIKPKV